MNKYSVKTNSRDSRIIEILNHKAKLIQKAIKEIEAAANKKIKEIENER
jgi:hypothetical protein